MLPQLVWDYVASGRLDKQIDFSADDKILAAAGKAASSSSYTNSHSNGNGNGNSSGSAKGLQFSAEQLAFLERKRAGSTSPAPAPVRRARRASTVALLAWPQGLSSFAHACS